MDAGISLIDVWPSSELLGADAFEQYQDYQSTVMQRRRAPLFDARLDSHNKLTSDQKERLIVLLQDQFEQEIQQPVTGLQNAVPLFSADREAKAEAIARRHLRASLPHGPHPDPIDNRATSNMLDVPEVANDRRY